MLAVINEIPNISALVNSLYDCRYRDFMMAIVELNAQLENDRYFATHSTYLVRELRILAYTQVIVGCVLIRTDGASRLTNENLSVSVRLN